MNRSDHVQVSHNCAVLHSQLFHRPIRRDLTNWRVFFDVIVIAAELMDADKVKGINQLPAAWIRCVVAVQELIIVVQHCPGYGCSAGICQSVGMVCFCVCVRNIGLYGASDIVRTAK